MDPTVPQTPRVLVAADFEPFVGREVRFADSGFTLTLSEIERSSGAPAPGASRTPFVLIFSGAKGATHLHEGMYLCEFADDTAHAIYVSPIHTPSADRQDYQAVFD